MITQVTRRIPIVHPAYAGAAIPNDWQKWQIKKFREIREVKGCSPKDRVIGVPVYGDSLQAEGIFHGDLLITKITTEYKPGKIGVWQTPHGETAKYARENFDGSITLHNKIDWSQDWHPDDIELIGIVVRIERDME